MSQVRPATYGPRSMTCVVTVWPLYRNVTFVPHGSVRCATPTVSFWSPPGIIPQAPPLP